MSKFRYTVDFGDLRINKQVPREEPLDVPKILRGWHTLHYFYNELSINDCAILLKAELKGNKRDIIVDRLKSRIRKLVAQEITEVLDDFADQKSK